MKKNIYFLIIFILALTSLNAQKISEGTTVDLDGLAVSFTILNKESITVSNKNYDRYKVSASLVNKSDKNFTVRLNSAPQILTNIDLVELDCVNATGAKLTSKKIKLKLKPQNLNVNYWAYSKDGKYQSFTIPVIAGYFLDKNDEVNDEAIFIVPQGEELNIVARKLM